MRAEMLIDIAFLLDQLDMIGNVMTNNPTAFNEIKVSSRGCHGYQEKFECSDFLSGFSSLLSAWLVI